MFFHSQISRKGYYCTKWFPFFVQVSVSTFPFIQLIQRGDESAVRWLVLMQDLLLDLPLKDVSLKSIANLCTVVVTTVCIYLPFHSLLMGQNHATFIQCHTQVSKTTGAPRHQRILNDPRPQRKTHNSIHSPNARKIFGEYCWIEDVCFPLVNCSTRRKSTGLDPAGRPNPNDGFNLSGLNSSNANKLPEFGIFHMELET